MNSHSELTQFVLLRIFIGESDMAGNIPLFQAIVKAAHANHLKGATVLRGIMGFGQQNIIHSTKLLELTSQLPVVVEIVDTEEKIVSFIPEVKDLCKISGTGGFITSEKVTGISFRHNDG
jgi:uncharacterized protein